MPDALVMNDGTRVTAARQWTTSRPFDRYPTDAEREAAIAAAAKK
jgi:hypothetical protein